MLARAPPEKLPLISCQNVISREVGGSCSAEEGGRGGDGEEGRGQTRRRWSSGWSSRRRASGACGSPLLRPSPDPALRLREHHTQQPASAAPCLEVHPCPASSRAFVSCASLPVVCAAARFRWVLCWRVPAGMLQKLLQKLPQELAPPRVKLNCQLCGSARAGARQHALPLSCAQCCSLALPVDTSWLVKVYIGA